MGEKAGSIAAAGKARGGYGRGGIHASGSRGGTSSMTHGRTTTRNTTAAEATATIMAKNDRASARATSQTGAIYAALACVSTGHSLRPQDWASAIAFPQWTQTAMGWAGRKSSAETAPAVAARIRSICSGRGVRLPAFHFRTAPLDAPMEAAKAASVMVFASR